MRRTFIVAMPSRVLGSVAILGLVAGSQVPHLSPARQLVSPRRVEAVPVPATLQKPSTRVEVLETYGRLPLHFEANQGQTDRQVKFLARGRGYTLFLTSTEAVLVLRQAQAPPRPFPLPGERNGEEAAEATEVNATVLRMKLLGANPQPKVEGLEELPARVNYFLGNDPTKWRTDVPTYAKVKYEAVYPGVDLVYYGNQRRVEYDFIVAPGTDPNIIRLGFEGADHLEIDARGDLIIRTSGGDIRQKKPFIYQETNKHKQAIHGRYVIKGTHHVGIQVAAYDASRPLVIDPVLSYSTYLGGRGDPFDLGLAIAVDSSGNAYVTGETRSPDFPIVNPLQRALPGFVAAFVTKLNPDGSVAYSTFLGGNHTAVGHGIAVDSFGNVYVTGGTSSTDFPTTRGAFQPTCVSTCFSDAFATKLNATGSALVYSTYLGGSETDNGVSIAVDTAGNAYVYGWTTSIDFPTTKGGFQTTFGGGTRDVFLTKLNFDGSALIYSTYLGGSGDDFILTQEISGKGLALDSSGNAYLTGTTSSSDFPTTPGSFQTVFRGGSVANNVNHDAFVAKIDPSKSGASSLVYSTYLGGSEAELGSGIAVDGAGNPYVTGATGSTDFPTANPIQPRLGRFVSAYVTKLNGSGSALVYSTYLGGTGALKNVEDGVGIAVDSSGNAYVTGRTASPDFPITAGAFQTTLRSSYDAFVTKLDATGTVILYSTYLGGGVAAGGGFFAFAGGAMEVGSGIAVDVDSNAYVTGSTNAADFPTTQGAFQTAFGGGVTDAFVAKLSTTAPLIPLQFVLFPAAFPSLPPEGEVGKFYVGNIGIGGGRAPYTITIVKGSLPPGLSFTSPVISGTPAQALAALFTLQVKDQLSVIEKEFQITIRPSSTLLTLQVGRAGTGSGTVTSTPDGVACGATCAAFYATGTAVTLTAAPAADSTFTGWSEDCAGQGNPCVLTMTTNKSVAATFNLSNPAPTARVILNGSQFQAGQTLTLGIQVENPAGNPTADLYIGAVLSDGQTAVFFSALGVLAGVFRLTAPVAFPPMQAVPPGSSLNLPLFFQFTFPPSGVEPGTYQVFAALVPQGALQDNRIDPGDILALDVRAFAFSP